METNDLEKLQPKLLHIKEHGVKLHDIYEGVIEIDNRKPLPEIRFTQLFVPIEGQFIELEKVMTGTEPTPQHPGKPSFESETVELEQFQVNQVRSKEKFFEDGPRLSVEDHCHVVAERMFQLLENGLTMEILEDLLEPVNQKIPGDDKPLLYKYEEFVAGIFDSEIGFYKEADLNE